LAPATKPFPALLPKADAGFGALHISSNDLVVLVLTAVLLGVLWFIVQKTKLGMAMRAVSFNEQAAALMGVNVNRIISFTFGLGLRARGGRGHFLCDACTGH
jgi:branched-chain amino acid transport system permease protein